VYVFIGTRCTVHAGVRELEFSFSSVSVLLTSPNSGSFRGREMTVGGQMFVTVFAPEGTCNERDNGNVVMATELGTR